MGHISALSFPNPKRVKLNVKVLSFSLSTPYKHGDYPALCCIRAIWWAYCLRGMVLEQVTISDPFILKSIVKIHLFDIIRLGLNQDSLFKWFILVLLLCVIHPSMYHFFKRDQRFLSFDIYSSNYILILCHKSKHLHVCGNGGAQQFHVEMKSAEN